MVKDGSVISTLDFVDLLHNNTPKDELTGVAFIAPEFEIPNAVPGAFQWRKKYKEQFGKDATYVEAYAYDTGRIIVAAKKKGGTVTEETIRSVLPFKGITGNIQLDQDGDLISTLTIAKISADGTIEEIK
jgi:ABC-type branched-subunit amino acid transport system substrate-binding protein